MPAKSKPTFGHRLRELREARGWSQQDLAIKAGITQSGISYLEIGKKDPGWETVQALARALEVSTEDFRRK
jgi:transcriptional regulator with XRE-family HTH domain